MYIVANVVSDYILLTVFVKFYNLSQLLCNFCPICSCPSRAKAEAGREWKIKIVVNKS